MINKYQSFRVIAAVDSNWGIGKDGLIPWRFSEDFKWFKRATTGATCFMGRKTYDELAVIMKGKKELLPGRKCVVITRSPIEDERVQVLSDLSKYMEHSNEVNYFIGGQFVFEFDMSVADTAYITRIPGDYGCDVKFSETWLDGFALGDTEELAPDLIVEKYVRVAPEVDGCY